jgi:hypothetical protein
LITALRYSSSSPTNSRSSRIPERASCFVQTGKGAWVIDSEQKISNYNGKKDSVTVMLLLVTGLHFKQMETLFCGQHPCTGLVPRSQEWKGFVLSWKVISRWSKVFFYRPNQTRSIDPLNGNLMHDGCLPLAYQFEN